MPELTPQSNQDSLERRTRGNADAGWGDMEVPQPRHGIDISRIIRHVIDAPIEPVKLPETTEHTKITD